MGILRGQGEIPSLCRVMAWKRRVVNWTGACAIITCTHCRLHALHSLDVRCLLSTAKSRPSDY